jgi:hypothetical protein
MEQSLPCALDSYAARNDWNRMFIAISSTLNAKHNLKKPDSSFSLGVQTDVSGKAIHPETLYRFFTVMIILILIVSKIKLCSQQAVKTYRAMRC